jgi:uncharacterized protein (DUF1684 family)
MEKNHIKKKFNRNFLSFLIVSLFTLILIGTRNPPFLKGEENPLEDRVEKLKTFRERRDRFFKEDPNSPLKEFDRKNFKGLRYFPIDMRYTMVGVIKPYSDSKSLYVYLPTNKGRDKKYVRYGYFRFKWEGREYVLQVYRPLGGGELFLPFKDKTSGKETYPDGRYLPIETMPEGKVLIDFNRASNPFCEYNEKYLCPFAPQENWLPIEIRAGEKRYRHSP